MQSTVILNAMYSAQLLDHFEHPRHAGELQEPSAQALVENPACGDVLALGIRVEGGRIAEIAFRAKGCVPAMACASAVTELVRGRSIDEAASITKEDVRAAVDGVPPASGHALDLAVDAVQAVLSRFRTSR
jgi:NifU-like protein involved in Fe-S cluster formation